MQLHGSDLSLYGGEDVHYDWLRVSGEGGFRHKFAGCRLCSVEWAVGGSVEKHLWDTSTVPLFSKHVKDVERLFKVYSRVTFRF